MISKNYRHVTDIQSSAVIPEERKMGGGWKKKPLAFSINPTKHSKIMKTASWGFV